MRRLAVAMIVKNESSCIAKCLKSLKEFPEKFVLDTGSTDDTVEIVSKFIPNVFSNIYKWNDSFADARNFLNNLIDAEWILSIDADEVLESHAYEKVKKAIEEADKKGFKTVSINMENKSSGETHYFPRLYRSSCKWKGNIHNYLDVSEKNNSDIKIYYGYSEAHKKDPDRSLRILTKEVNAGGKVREIYYLAHEYWFRKQYQEAINWYDKYLAVATWQIEMADAYLMRARCYANLKNYKMARESCMHAININADFKEALDLMGRLTGPNNAARWHQYAYHATNKNVLFKRDIRNYRDKQLVKCIPSIFNYKSILYIGANIYRCDVLKDFRNHGYEIDILEPFKRNVDYYNGVIGINKVYQATIQQFRQNKYDVVFWWHGPEHITKADIPISLSNMEEMADKLVVLGAPWGHNEQVAIYGNSLEEHISTLYAEDFTSFGYHTDAVGTKDTWVSNLLIWKDIK